MKLIRIAEYFSRDNQTQKTDSKQSRDAVTQSATDGAAVSRNSDEAVRVASSLKNLPAKDSSAVDGDRAKKVAELAKIVRSGSYSADTQAVASKLYVDLF